MLKFLFPNAENRSFKPKGFKERFLKQKENVTMEDEYVMIGDGQEEPQDYIEEPSPLNSAASYSYGRNENEYYDDESPLPSVRRTEHVPAGIPKLTFTMAKGPNQDANIAQKVIANEFKLNKFVPPLNFNSSAAVDMEIILNPNPLNGFPLSSEDRSNEVSQSASSFGNLESPATRTKDERQQENKPQIPSRRIYLF